MRRGRLEILTSLPFLSLFLCSGCDVPFDPKGQYTEKLVVYAVLDPTKRVQFARVYRTYNVEGLDPRQNTIDPQVRNASVEVKDETGRAFAFRDTVIKRELSDRYSTDVFAYYTDRFVPVSGKRYTLEVTVPQYGKVSSTVTVPDPFMVYVNGSRARSLLADPAVSECNCISVSLFSGYGAKGHLTRFYIDYAINKPGVPEVTSRKEVPLSLRRNPDGSIVPVYPQPDRIPFMVFPKELFDATMNEILKSDPSAEIEIEKVTFLSHALEPNLYNYYLITHGFGDPFTVRLDLPDFTNIQNGLGVFGGLAVDSLTIPIR